MDMLGKLCFNDWILVCILLCMLAYLVYMGHRPLLLVSNPDTIKAIMVKEFSRTPNRPKTFLPRNEMKYSLLNADDDQWRFLRNTLLPTFSSGKMRMKPVDLLQLMLNTHHDTGVDESENIHSFEGDGNPWKTRSLTMDEIVGNSILFLLVGYDTTSNALAFTAYNLATHPECQEKLIEEIDAILGKEPPNYDNVQNLEYLERVFCETLRLYPSACRTHRLAERDIVIEEYTVPKGTDISFPIYSIHRDPRFWENPTRFDPESCIGMRLAQVEMQLAIVSILQHYRFKTCEETEVSKEARPLMIRLTLDTLAGVTHRLAERDIVIEGYTVPKGIDISFPIYSIHRDPRFWENPTRFDPERFTPENKAKRHPYAYLPFGHGPRSCIGMRLAQVEMRLAIVSILQHYRFKTCEETEVSKKLDP
uniref:Uncharacterized protein n=1 Tax=Magallana gigas TaxID=29159 RepID=A0A8W8NXU4_MAGGI